jgi:hypothetical protein
MKNYGNFKITHSVTCRNNSSRKRALTSYNGFSISLKNYVLILVVQIIKYSIAIHPLKQDIYPQENI